MTFPQDAARVPPQPNGAGDQNPAPEAGVEPGDEDPVIPDLPDPPLNVHPEPPPPAQGKMYYMIYVFFFTGEYDFNSIHVSDIIMYYHVYNTCIYTFERGCMDFESTCCIIFTGLMHIVLLNL